MPLIEDASFQLHIDAAINELISAGEQMELDHCPEGDPRWTAYDNQWYEIEKRLITDAINYDRVFAQEILHQIFTR